MSVQLQRLQFTVDEYHRMAEAGILTDEDRVELIEGEIVQMSPIGRRHAACVNRLNRLFSQRLGACAIVAVQNPVELSSRSEPQPDLALLQPRPDFYESGHPQPEDVLLLVEVADTTAESDREVKLPLYARSAIAEVWLVDIERQCLEVYLMPSLNKYQNVRKYQRGETLFVQAFSDVSFNVDEILG
jgi:Uma2 family endonuclease